MKKKIGVLIFLLLLIPSVVAYTQENEIIETNINLEIERGDCFWINSTCSWMNLTIETEDDNYYFYNISNLTLDQEINIQFLRDIECDEGTESACEDINNLSKTMLSVCNTMSTEYEKVFSANTQCSLNLLGCRNEINTTANWETKYKACELKTCPECEECKTDIFGLIGAMVVGIGIGWVIANNKKTSNRDIDKGQVPIREEGQVPSKKMDELKRKYEDIKKNAKEKIKEGVDKTKENIEKAREGLED